MSDIISLNNICVGEKAIVTSLKSGDDIVRRLIDIGIISGTEIKCVGKSPLGDPYAYLIKGAVIALRKSDSDSIAVVRVKEKQ